MRLVNILGANISEFVTVIGKDIEIFPETVVSGELSRDAEDTYTLYVKQAFDGDESCVTPSVFVGSISAQSFKSISKKAIAFSLKVYCKGAGKYNSFFVDCIASSKQSDFISQWCLASETKTPMVALAGKVEFKAEEYNGKTYEKVKLLVNNISLAGLAPKGNNSDAPASSTKKTNPKSKAAQQEELELDCPF